MCLPFEKMPFFLKSSVVSHAVTTLLDCTDEALFEYSVPVEDNHSVQNHE